jgi:radical SAM protein with 4Fe4S-binding SPASM domain
LGLRFTVDIELTNRCNAKCHFCPRDATPHQGLMTEQVFHRSLERAVEYRSFMEREFDGAEVALSLCGLGEPLLNRMAADAVREVKAAGFSCMLSSNGALLDEVRAGALLDAGLDQIFINVGELDDDYESVYRLPFEKTRDNVLRFAEMAEGRCEVRIVLVNHRRDAEHLRAMRAYWRRHGLKLFDTFEIMNRGGALFVDHMQFAAYPEQQQAKALLADTGCTPLCGAPFAYLFIGYDGQYYLCCSDWTKEVPMGSVFDRSFMDVAQQKLDHIESREPVCKTCNHDPLNRVTEKLCAGDEEEAVRTLVQEIATTSTAIRGAVDEMMKRAGVGASVPPRRRIPVVAE